MIAVFCCDIGSIKRGNFGWARTVIGRDERGCQTGTNIQKFTELIAADLNCGYHVALGFECPLFLPIADDPVELTSARPGEGNRPWSAGAGSGAVSTGLTETLWILDQVKANTSTAFNAFADWQSFIEAPSGLFVWEAFVTKSAKSDSHHGDAELAVMSFVESLPNPGDSNAIHCPGRVRSLIGAALLQAGWSSDLMWLARPCVVIRT